MRVARAGAQRPDLDEAHGERSSVFSRRRRWLEAGVFDAMPESLAQVVERDPGGDTIASTIVRARHCAAGMGG